MNISNDMIEGIYTAGKIHDIGKLAVPSEILSKPTRLSQPEIELIRSHPENGYNILKNIDFPWPIAQIVYQHHERVDGTGYPRGLNGNNILLEAKIIAVSDVVEAMASHRPYRPGLGIDVALEEIEKFSGSYFDPDVVEACVALFHENKYALALT
jgi:HD-GYP domain-containing protein (c-di-GMP phosphodiesterase class II)